MAAQLGGKVAGSRAPERVLAQVAAPELELVRVEALLELVRVEALLELVRVGPELELVRVEALLELVRVEALAVPSDPRALLVGALRIRLVTAAHPHDLVPLLEAGEDLAAAVAETTREPAAAEAVIA
jgi:hypothetical protein